LQLYNSKVDIDIDRTFGIYHMLQNTENMHRMPTLNQAAPQNHSLRTSHVQNI